MTHIYFSALIESFFFTGVVVSSIYLYVCMLHITILFAEVCQKESIVDEYLHLDSWRLVWWLVLGESCALISEDLCTSH